MILIWHKYSLLHRRIFRMRKILLPRIQTLHIFILCLAWYKVRFFEDFNESSGRKCCILKISRRTRTLTFIELFLQSVRNLKYWRPKSTCHRRAFWSAHLMCLDDKSAVIWLAVKILLIFLFLVKDRIYLKIKKKKKRNKIIKTHKAL